MERVLKVVSKHELGERRVYDLTVADTHTYVANGAVVHNCGAQRFIKKFMPRCLADIAVATALYRPGPLAAKYDDIYLAAKADPSSVTYDHPAIEKVLGYTMGCVVFQEQLMFLGHELAGLSLADCDRLRKAIVKRSVSGNAKNKGEVALLEEMFIDGSEKNGYPREKSTALYEKLAGYASYCFNACCTSATLVDTYSKQTWQLQKKSIKDVEPGDLVRSRDEKTGRDIFIPVKKRHYSGRKKVVEVTLTTGEKVRCTLDHKFRVQETGEMLPLSEIIAKGLSIVTNAGPFSPIGVGSAGCVSPSA